jgi:hypothetical protein
MQSFTVTKGSTSVILPVSIYDSSSTTGAKLAGLVYNSGSLTAYYNRMGASGAATAISLVTATKGTWTSSGFVAIDGTNMPGDYELHVPDAALATGVNEVAIQLKGATNMVPVNLTVHLTATDRQDSVRGGMTALPNAAAAASGGLYIRGAGAGAINQDANGRVDVNVVAWSADTTMVANLLASGKVMLTGTVSTAGFTPTTSAFETAATAEATADHFVGRIVLWTSGALQYQQALITAYTLTGGKGHFTVTTMTDSPANTDAFIIV